MFAGEMRTALAVAGSWSRLPPHLRGVTPTAPLLFGREAFMASIEDRIDQAADATRSATDNIFGGAKSAVSAARSLARKAAKKVTAAGKTMEKRGRRVRKTGRRAEKRMR